VHRPGPGIAWRIAREGRVLRRAHGDGRARDGGAGSTAVALSLERIGAAEAIAARAYRASVEAQRADDATPIPKLSASGGGRGDPCSHPDENTRVALWRGLTVDKAIGPELERFSSAVRQRFCENTVRAMPRAKGGSADAASVPLAHEASLATVSRTIHTLRPGERAEQVERLSNVIRSEPALA
jgi:hypothetical protein